MRLSLLVALPVAPRPIVDHSRPRACRGPRRPSSLSAETGRLQPATMARRIDSQYYDVFITAHDLDSPRYVKHDFRLPKGLLSTSGRIMCSDGRRRAFGLRPPQAMRACPLSFVLCYDYGLDAAAKSHNKGQRVDVRRRTSRSTSAPHPRRARLPQAGHPVQGHHAPARRRLGLPHRRKGSRRRSGGAWDRRRHAAEARGFIFGAPLALELGAGFVPIRKPGSSRTRPSRASTTSNMAANGWTSTRGRSPRAAASSCSTTSSPPAVPMRLPRPRRPGRGRRRRLRLPRRAVVPRRPRGARPRRGLQPDPLLRADPPGPRPQ